MHELFGVEKLTRYGLVDVIEDDVVEFTFLEDFGGIEAGHHAVVASCRQRELARVPAG